MSVPTSISEMSSQITPEPNLSSWLRSKVKLEYVLADLRSRNDVDLNIDLTKIPFPKSTFDAIICNHVLEHISNDRIAMAELFRVLKPNGWAMLQVPISFHLAATYEDFSITDPMDRERAFGQIDHVRIYAMDYVDRSRHPATLLYYFLHHFRIDNSDDIKLQIGIFEFRNDIELQACSGGQL